MATKVEQCVNVGPYGKNMLILFFSETNEILYSKLTVLG